MNIDDLTLKQIKEISGLTANLGQSAQKKDDVGCYSIGQKCIIRTYSAGVHYGVLAKRSGREVILDRAIRLWYWDGACSLSQLALEGTKKPSDCKFSVTLPSILLTEAVEVIPCTSAAITSIEGVAPWKK